MTNNLINQIVLTGDTFLRWKQKCEEFVQDYILEYNKIPNITSHEQLKLKNNRLILFCEVDENKKIEYEIPNKEWSWKS